MSDGFIYLALADSARLRGDAPAAALRRHFGRLHAARRARREARRPLGRGQVFVAGYALLLVVYAALLLAGGGMG